MDYRQLVRIAAVVLLGLATAATAGAQAPEGRAEPLAAVPAGPPESSGSEKELQNAPQSVGGPSSHDRPQGAEAHPEAPPPASHVGSLCIEVARAALEHDLPLAFFTRLIWQESRFNTHARSHVGAEGIAQFMPATARWRGLVDSFEPSQALFESARWLRELWLQFGSLGLAAAAYNAGPGRVQEWLAGRIGLPGETRAYVAIITGRPAEAWKAGEATDEILVRLGNTLPCTQIEKALAPRVVRAPSSSPAARAPAGPWGLQLAGNWSMNAVLAEYRGLQRRFPAVLGNREPLVLRSRLFGRAPWYLVRVAETTRERAQGLCSRLESAGGRCIVLRN
jgi:hypothetical protein